MLDTNVLISAAWKPGGLEARTLALAISGSLTPCISVPMWAEYREVLGRKKFASRKEPIDALLSGLEARALAVEPQERLTMATDEEDNRFLECASAAKAEYLITGNLRHYPLAIGPTRIVNAREFLNAFLGSGFFSESGAREN